jgi:hypothetical protein
MLNARRWCSLFVFGMWEILAILGASPRSGVLGMPNRHQREGAWTMSNRAKALSEQARELSPADRIALVEEVLDSLDSADPAIDDLWIREAKDRLMAYRRGDLAAKDLSEIVAKYGLWLSGS